MASAACPLLGRSIIHHFDESLLMDPSHKLLETHLVLLVLVLPVPRWARCSVTAEPTPANGRSGWRAFLRGFVGCPWRIASRITPHPSLYLLYTAITYRLYPLSPPPVPLSPSLSLPCYRLVGRTHGWTQERTELFRPVPSNNVTSVSTSLFLPLFIPCHRSLPWLSYSASAVLFLPYGGSNSNILHHTQALNSVSH